MPWIRFGREEPPAPSLPLRNLEGGTVSVGDYRGRAALALVFLHGPACTTCRELAVAWTARQREMQALGAELLFVLPPAGDNPAGNGRDRLDPARTLLDPGGQLRARYAGLLEFDTTGQVLIYVLDEYGSPYAAWVGAEPDDSAIWYDLTRWLLYVSIQCPE